MYVQCISLVPVIENATVLKNCGPLLCIGCVIGSASSSVTSESNPLGQHTSPCLVDAPDHLKPIYAELQERRQEVEMLKVTVETLKVLFGGINFLACALSLTVESLYV